MELSDKEDKCQEPEEPLCKGIDWEGLAWILKAFVWLVTVFAIINGIENHVRKEPYLLNL